MKEIYDIYHDELKEDGYWHCFLFVPHSTKNIVLKELIEVRDIINGNIHFCDARTYGKSKIDGCKSLLSILSSALQQIDKDKLEPFYKREKGNYSKEENRLYGNYFSFEKSPGWKIAIFHQKNNHKDMNFGDELSRIETTFRMGLQGAKHFLFDKTKKNYINKIYIDGFEHYPNNASDNRNFNIEKIKNKLISNSREYINFLEDFNIEDGKLDKNNKFILDLIDLFLGITRLKYLGEENDDRLILFEPIKELFNKLNSGNVRMKNSRFDKFGTFSSGYIENGNWKFENLSMKILKNNKINKNQISLF